MTSALSVVDFGYHLQSIVETAVFEDGQEGSKFLRGKWMFLADFIFFYDQKLFVIG